MTLAVENYNQIVPQQRALTQAIDEALSTIVEALKAKLQLAAQQKQLQSEINIHYPELSTENVRAKILDQVARRLEGRDSTQLRDWTTRLANSGGNLEE